MKKLLNTLYVTKENAYLSKDGENIVIREEGVELGRFPKHIIESIICFNYTGVSPALLAMCLENQITLSFVNPYGKFCGSLTGSTNGNVLLRRRQYAMADNESSLEFVRNIIYAKGLNSKKILKRAILDHGQRIGKEKIEKKVQNIALLLQEIKNASDKDSIRGFEGAIAKEYFDCFDECILKQKQDFYFHGRSKRPPMDRVNAMLSFLYTLLAHDVSSALLCVGIDSYVGFFHADRPGRASMALDMMEEFRAYLVDRTVISLINLNIIDAVDFETKESGAVLLNDKGRKKVLEYWQKRKQTEIVHPYLKEKIKIGLLPYAQALLLNRYLRQDIDAYPPFLIKE
ncbi:MAG: type I-C CRISPR-associated endonuclease Cas1c [Eubacteriales bacterium]|nr:type I-C CRISPR-associated endonuclease Cas1c [Eubacteriales bacterium]